MSTDTLSSDDEISLPKERLESMHLQPGQEFELIPMGAIIQMVPKQSVEELKSAIATGIARSKGCPADEVFDRLESKYRTPEPRF
jgi:hypothetical protein